MKKVLLSVLAVGMLTACSQEETISQQAPTQIAFESAFVNNATRAADPSFNNEDNLLTKFSVWGYVVNTNGTGQVFNDVPVEKSEETNEWSYSPLQYWMPNNQYHFFALATNTTTDYKGQVADEYLAKNGIGKISFTNVDGTEDLLYATAERTTGASITTAPEKVNFNFDHLLAKVKFSFVNGFTTGYSTIKVTNIKMTVPGQGSISLNEQFAKKGQFIWTLENGAATILDFGTMSESAEIKEGDKGESDNERMTIPAAADQEYTVTFDAELFQDGASVLTSKKAVKITGCQLLSGYAYNFVATLDPTNIGENPLFPIEFEAEVEEWIEAEDYDGGIIPTENLLTSTEVITENYDGEGKTVYAADDRAKGQNGIFVPQGDVTISNVTIDGQNGATEAGEGYRGIYITKGGNYILDGVTIKNVSYAINVNTTEDVTLTVKNSTLEGWTSFGNSTTASFEKVKFECGKFANFKPYTSVTLTDCSFEEGFMIDFTSLTGTITLKNCTYNGTVLTVENFATVVSKIDGTPSVAF